MLFSMQKRLDTYIMQNNNLQENEELFQKKILALLVELGELANETRCFKFWSMKPSSAKEKVLEEYVDGIHFILSLGLDKNLEFVSQHTDVVDLSTTDHFIHVFKKCILFKNNPTQPNYHSLFTSYLQLGALLGFNEEDIQKAYTQKNEINFERQDQGY